MSYNINVDDWYDDAITLKAKGFSTRKIAVALFNNENYRNRLNVFYKQESVIEDVEKRAKELEIEDSVIGVQLQNDYTNWEVKPKPELSKPKQTILVVADTQAKPTESLEYMLWIGAYIAETKPDVVVHIGDHYDMPSLSSYDKGKASSEGRRFVDDLEAGNKGLELLNLSMHKDIKYKPRKVFCKGNHEHRIDRYVEDNPELKGTIGTEFLPLEKYGWEVYDFLQPVEIGGIYFVHYLANPMSGKPYGGNAMNILKTVGRSFVVGHKQTLDSAIRPTIDGKLQLGIINGACYPFDEKYKGYFGNIHFRGITMLTEVNDGFGLPSFISLDHLKERYYV